MNILLVEPHPDDILLSLYHIIKKYLSLSDNLYLITVTQPDRNKEDSSKFCGKMNIKYLGNLQLENISWRLRASYRSSWDELYHYYEKYFKDKDVFLSNILKIINQNKIDIVFSPLGILHPEHYFVRFCLDLISTEKRYYADVPYQYRKYGLRLILTSGKITTFEYIPTEAQVQEKIDIFLDCYHSQRNIILNSWNESKNLAKGEMILV